MRQQSVEENSDTRTIRIMWLVELQQNDATTANEKQSSGRRC